VGGHVADGGTGGLTRRIIGAGIEVHRRLGPGLLELTYLRLPDLRVKALAGGGFQRIPLEP
jgi:hypothetical protein